MSQNNESNINSTLNAYIVQPESYRIQVTIYALVISHQLPYLTYPLLLPYSVALDLLSQI